MFKIINLQEVDSTNDYAQRLLDESTFSQNTNIVLVAQNQTNGRGAYENKWSSKNAENLTFSIILTPDIGASQQFILSKITSLSIIDFLLEHKIAAEIKWPNDILINKKKIAGILIENSIIGSKLDDSIIGIGLNINQTDFLQIPNATSLKNEKNLNFDLEIELSLFLTKFEFWFKECNNHNFKYIDEMYLKFLFGKNEFVKYSCQNGYFEAKVQNVDEFGRIIVKTTQNELKQYMFKEIEMIY